MLVDTSAWIEYFKATEKGKRIVSLLQEGRALYTCPLTIAELTHWCLKNNKDPLPFIQKVMSFSRLLDLTVDILVVSAKICYKERIKNDKIGMIDCIIYASALAHNLPLLTTDQDFSGLSGVEFL